MKLTLLLGGIVAATTMAACAPEGKDQRPDFGPVNALRPLFDLPPVADAPCQPTAELCNGVDDDCDGLIDDADPDIEAATVTNVDHCGACDMKCEAPSIVRSACRMGLCRVAMCTPGFRDYNGDYADGCESNCTLSNGATEACDNADNDCDGATDEGFDLQVDDQNCGACGETCEAVPGGNTGCSLGACVLSQCDAGLVDANADLSDGCEYACVLRATELIREFCNGLDDDCDRRIDEAADLTLPAEDFCGQPGVCAYECGEDADCGDPGLRCNGGHVCVDVSGLGLGASCVDDAECQAIHGGLACVTTMGQDGVPLRSCVERRHEPICDAGAGFRCVRSPHVSTGNELARCDGLDNDCDGDIDEDFVAALFVDGVRRQTPRTCTAGQGACRGLGAIRCTDDGLGTVCDAVELEPEGDRDESCDGRDDDCDGQLDEDFVDAVVRVGAVDVFAYEASRPGANNVTPGLDLVPDDGVDAYIETRACSRAGTLPWANVSAAEAQGACAAAGGRLCTRDEWTAACAGAAANAYPYGRDYNAQTCNGGAFDTDRLAAGNQDHALAGGTLVDCRAQGIYDLSGNLKEWTDDVVDGLRVVRGGGYESNVPAGLTCSAVNDLKPDELRSSTLGFRCCRGQ